MALSKKIENKNGVITNYHRIVSINQIINEQTIIEVASYTSKEKRDEEVNNLKKARETGEYVENDIYIDADHITKEYNEKDDIESAYKYIKGLDKFKGAKDV